MNPGTCVVCGAENSTCVGDPHTVVVISGLRPTGPKMRVPLQKPHRLGVAGYQGNVEVYDPSAPSLPIVQPAQLIEEAEDSEEADEKMAKHKVENKKRKTKPKDKSDA